MGAGAKTNRTTMTSIHRLALRAGLATAALWAGVLPLAASAAGTAAPVLRLDAGLVYHESGEAAPEAAAGPLELALSDDIGDSIASRLVVSTADALIGVPYRLGGDSLDDIDCSALVQLAYREAGLELPRTTRDLMHEGVRVARSDLRLGDLLFYRWKRRLHVAVYAGNGEIVHASPNAQQVTRTRLNKSWDRRLVSVRRLI